MNCLNTISGISRNLCGEERYIRRWAICSVASFWISLCGRGLAMSLCDSCSTEIKTSIRVLSWVGMSPVLVLATIGNIGLICLACDKVYRLFRGVPEEQIPLLQNREILGKRETENV